MATDDKAKEIAEEVNRISLDYHLSHATFACDKLIQKEYRLFVENKSRAISNELKTAVRKNDTGDIKRLTEENALLTSKINHHVYVEYVPGMDENSGRVVKTNNQLVINLPMSLLDKTRNDDGTYNGDAVKRLRKLMAHELGHIALHTNEILNTDSTRGTLDLKSEKNEQEVETFAARLLELRHERTKYISSNIEGLGF